ncbi:TlyA family RNA methyltransferase [Halioxenophilus aromaticivorans]|uniref:TlyA family rRNA (Cytidine-2'-O)-methyltransferase n=1 Tax=Halioxenophilus aromaticivorans TaxID=1306992 RepID=A0AAV3U5E1_9ALTE
MTELKSRADQWLVNHGLASSRAEAARLIKAGAVTQQVAGQWQTVAKPSVALLATARVQVADGALNPYVSRGAFKLAEIASANSVSCSNVTALDVGQSTGGFTDFLLQQGAAKVVGLEVGRDQLAPKLRQDPRVVCLEGVNARDLSGIDLAQHAPQGFDVIVMDVSFISQTLILPNLPALMRPGGWLLSLVKPQFEVGKEGVGKGGLVRDEALFEQVRQSIEACVEGLGLRVKDYRPSPITGGDGNREFLLAALKL